MDITEYLKSALQSNLPIDWKALCIQVHDAAMQRVTELERQLKDVQPVITDKAA